MPRSAAALVVMRAVAGSVSLPHQWSPSEWVLTASVIGARDTSSCCASAIRRASRVSHAVSTTSDAVPASTTRPVFASPQPPGVRTTAHTPSPICVNPPSPTVRPPSAVAVSLTARAGPWFAPGRPGNAV